MFLTVSRVNALSNSKVNAFGKKIQHTFKVRNKVK